MSSNYEYLFKIVVIGESAVGKSALLIRYADDGFREGFRTTIGVDFKVKTITLQSRVIKLQIWDTAGQERFRTITASIYYKGAHGVVLCYDITDRASFDKLEHWLGEVKNSAPGDPPVLLCGLKLDLEERRAVPTQEASRFASKYRMKFVETSAKEDIGVEKAFLELAEVVLTETMKLPNEGRDMTRVTTMEENGPRSPSMCGCSQER